MFFDVLAGLIVGAIIRYSGSTSNHSTKWVYIDSVNNSDGPPDYIKLNMTVEQHAEPQFKLYRYEYKGETRDEKDLEEKVGICQKIP